MGAGGDADRSAESAADSGDSLGTVPVISGRLGPAVGQATRFAGRPAWPPVDPVPAVSVPAVQFRAI